MSKPRPIWQELPLDFKEQVVSLLNLESRVALSRCSRSDRELVRNSPVHLFNLEMMIHASDITIYIKHRDSINQKYQSYRNVIASIEFFVELLGSSKKSTFNYLKIHLGSCFFGDSYIFNRYNTLMSHLFSKCTRNNKLKVRHFRFSVYEPSKKSAKKWWLPDILQLFDPNYFESFHLDGQTEIHKSVISKIVKTQQWRSLKVYKEHCTEHEIMIENYLHLEQVDLRLSRTWKNEEVIQIVQNFQRQNRPVLSFFKLLGTVICSQVVEKLHIRPRSCEILSMEGQNDKVLVVNVESWRAVGVICRKGHEMEDFEQAINHNKVLY